jgi:hypothetical protein
MLFDDYTPFCSRNVKKKPVVKGKTKNKILQRSYTKLHYNDKID